MAVAHRIYARALFDAARGQDRVDVARDQLAELADALEASPELEVSTERTPFQMRAIPEPGVATQTAPFRSR